MPFVSIFANLRMIPYVQTRRVRQRDPIEPDSVEFPRKTSADHVLEFVLPAIKQLIDREFADRNQKIRLMKTNFEFEKLGTIFYFFRIRFTISAFRFTGKTSTDSGHVHLTTKDFLLDTDLMEPAEKGFTRRVGKGFAESFFVDAGGLT